MARIKIEITGRILATIKIPVRITDLNYGNHLGNDSMVRILHEARVRWLQQHNFSEMNMAGSALIMAGLSVEYVNESFFGDELSISISAGLISNAGFELFYDVHCIRDSKAIIICRAKTEMVCFDYSARKAIAIPEAAKEILV